MDSASEPTSGSTADRERANAPRVRCFMLVTRGMRTPTEVVHHLHSRNVEVTTFTTPIELFADSALLHIVNRMTERKGSSSPSGGKPLLIIIAEPTRCPDIDALINAFDKYFPKTALWTFERDRKPQLRRITGDRSTNTETAAPNHQVAAQTGSLSNLPDTGMHATGDITDEAESTPRIIRFADAVAASREWPRERVSTPDSHEYLDELRGDPLIPEEDDSLDPIFAPPNFSAVDDDFDDDDDESTENNSHRDFDESTASAQPTAADDANPPGFVSEEELALLLGDGDFLFTDSEEKSS